MQNPKHIGTKWEWKYIKIINTVAPIQRGFELTGSFILLLPLDICVCQVNHKQSKHNYYNVTYIAMIS